jgi:hypothetical protein
MQQYSFTTKLSKYDYGKYIYHVAYVPKNITDQLTFSSGLTLRVNINLDGVFWKGALSPDLVGTERTKHLIGSGGYKAGDRIWYIIVGKKIIQKIGKQLGDEVQVNFSIGDQNEVEIGSRLQQYFAKNPDLFYAFQKLTPGRQ